VIADPDPSAWILPAASKAWKHGRPRVVLLGGDGVGPEVVEAAARCLTALGAKPEIRGARDAEAELTPGAGLPDRLRAEIDGADATIFGAADTSKGRAVPVLRYLRFGIDTYANLRPAASLEGVPAVTGKGKTSLVIVRELSEGMYPGREGELSELRRRWPELRDRAGRELPDTAGRFAIRVVTERASLRVARYAADLAAHRKAAGAGPGKVTVVDKSNVLRESDGLFRRCCDQVIAEVGGLESEHVYIDEAARRMVAVPERHDVVVTTNLFGDILSDVSSEVMGGMPMAPSASIGDEAAYFEPCHGSAPDIEGAGKVNPTGTLLSAAMMLAYLHEPEAARALAGAVVQTIQGGCRTVDLGGDATCASFSREVCLRLGRT
jgi:homoisocitrate dehydrogenase